MKEIDDLWGSWFAGFAAGEGCFLIGKGNKESPRSRYRCHFKIALRDDDRAILEKIQNTLGIGIIYDNPVYPSNTRNAHPSTEFCITAINECAELVKVFEKYPLQAKKQDDFEVWKEAVVELVKPFACRDADLLEYYRLKIKEVRQYEAVEELPKPIVIDLQLTIKFA